MNYRTTCPNCASVFRLGEDQLGAAQGWVQCSVCGSPFDARPSLLMEDGSPLPPPEPAVAAAPPVESGPAAEPVPPETAPAATAQATANAETDEPVSAAEPAPAAESPRGIVQRETALDLDSIILIDPDIPVPEEPGPLPQIHPAPSRYPPPPAKPAAAKPAAAKPAAAKPAVTKAKKPTARIEYAASPVPPRKPRRQRQWLPRPPRIQPWMWGVASTLLATVLLAQTTYFLRDTLVSRLPQLRPVFEQACATLGCALSLPKNLAQLQIIGSDLQTEASGRLRLTLTLGNRAGHAQAWPVLVLTLTDQRDRPLARRSFAPSEYLGDTRRIADGVPPRSEQVLSLPLTVRGPAPMGFDLQLGY